MNWTWIGHVFYLRRALLYIYIIYMYIYIYILYPNIVDNRITFEDFLPILKNGEGSKPSGSQAQFVDGLNVFGSKVTSAAFFSSNPPTQKKKKRGQCLGKQGSEVQAICPLNRAPQAVIASLQWYNVTCVLRSIADMWTSSAWNIMMTPSLLQGRRH